MKKSFLLTSLILFFVVQLIAQDRFKVNTQEIPGSKPDNVFRLSLLVPALEAELSIDETKSLSIQTWLGFQYTWGGVTSFNLLGGLQIEPRFFVTQAKRWALGKRTDHYSGAYIGLPVQVELHTPYITSGIVFGFQNVIGQRGFWRIELGPGMLFYEDQLYLSRIGSFGIGFILE